MLTALTWSWDMRVASETGGCCSPCIRTGGMTDCSIEATTGGGVAATPAVAARHMGKKNIFILDSLLTYAPMDCTGLGAEGRGQRKAAPRTVFSGRQLRSQPRIVN